MTQNKANASQERNLDRAACGEAAMQAYSAAKEHNTTDWADFSSEEAQERLTDLLADLRHLARRDGLDYADADRVSANHFSCEAAEESEADKPDLLCAAKCALADLEGFLFDADVDPTDPAQADVPAVRTVKELKAAIAAAEPPPKHIPATLRGLPVLLVLANRFDDGVDCRWNVFNPNRLEPSGVLTRTLSGDYRYFPLSGLAISLGMAEKFLEFPTSEVKFGTPAFKSAPRRFPGAGYGDPCDRVSDSGPVSEKHSKP